MSIIEKTRRNLREGGLKQFLLASIRGGFVRVANIYLRPSEWQGRLVERLGNRARVDGVRLDLNGCDILTRHKAMLIKGFYESSERRLVKKYLPRDTPVVDLGGCLGVVSCVINRRLTDPTKHIVVEANPALIPFLERVRTLNNAKFQLVHAAVAYASDCVTFVVNPAIMASGLLNQKGQRVSVPAKTLGQLVREAGFERFNLVCDIEGAETELVEEEIDLLRERCEWIILEVHPHVHSPEIVDAMLNRLTNAGYAYVARNTNVVVMHHTA